MAAAWAVAFFMLPGFELPIRPLCLNECSSSRMFVLLVFADEPAFKGIDTSLIEDRVNLFDHLISRMKEISPQRKRGVMWWSTYKPAAQLRQSIPRSYYLSINVTVLDNLSRNLARNTLAQLHQFAPGRMSPEFICV
jgi:hypothetical protein